MAKKEEQAKIILERIYNIPLRKEWIKAPKYKKGKKAVKAAREFLQKHMKSNDVKIGKYLNMHILKHGMKNPPHHVKVTATKDDKGVVKAEIVGAPVVKTKEEKKKVKEKKEKAKEKPEKAETKKAEEKPVPEKEAKTDKMKEEKPKEEVKKAESAAHPKIQKELGKLEKQTQKLRQKALKKEGDK